MSILVSPATDCDAYWTNRVAKKEGEGKFSKASFSFFSLPQLSPFNCPSGESSHATSCPGNNRDDPLCYKNRHYLLFWWPAVIGMICLHDISFAGDVLCLITSFARSGQTTTEIGEEGFWREISHKANVGKRRERARRIISREGSIRFMAIRMGREGGGSKEGMQLGRREINVKLRRLEKKSQEGKASFIADRLPRFFIHRPRVEFVWCWANPDCSLCGWITAHREGKKPFLLRLYNER